MGQAKAQLGKLLNSCFSSSDFLAKTTMIYLRVVLLFKFCHRPEEELE
jgi:hypothetical protein